MDGLFHGGNAVNRVNCNLGFFLCERNGAGYLEESWKIRGLSNDADLLLLSSQSEWKPNTHFCSGVSLRAAGGCAG